MLLLNLGATWKLGRVNITPNFVMQMLAKSTAFGLCPLGPHSMYGCILNLQKWKLRGKYLSQKN